MRASIIAGVIAVASTASLGATLAGPIVRPATGHIYYLLSQNTWASSETEAMGLGGHLTAINDAAEQSFVFTSFGSFGNQQRLLWIGLNDSAVEGTFQWVSGDPVSYLNWAPGEPNDVGGNEDFVAIYYPNHSAGGQWNDWNDRTSDPIGLPFNGVVEVVPEPGTLLCPVLCGLLLIRWRGRR
jgi:hypothetical protein